MDYSTGVAAAVPLGTVAVAAKEGYYPSQDRSSGLRLGNGRSYYWDWVQALSCASCSSCFRNLELPTILPLGFGLGSGLLSFGVATCSSV